MTFNPEDSKRRKAMPLWAGCLMYFPDALLAVAEHSRKANEKHNPGEELHWSKHKSNDHANCVGRHLLDIGPNWDETDPEFGSLHAVALAWRALALAQIAIEAKRAGVPVQAYLKSLGEKANKTATDAPSSRVHYGDKLWRNEDGAPREVQKGTTGFSAVLIVDHVSGLTTNSFRSLEELASYVGPEKTYRREP